MKSSELRIGNLAYDNEAKAWFTIQSINLHGCKGVYSWGGGLFISSKCIEGIPLTEDWLRNNCLDKSCKFTKYKDSFILEIRYNDGWIALKTLKFIHELQNLYFALTGEELIIV